MVSATQLSWKTTDSPGRTPTPTPPMHHVLITGNSRGPGRALAHGFSAVAWTVSACATDSEAIQSLANELGPEHLALTCE